MVSSNNLILVGIALVVGFIVLRGGSSLATVPAVSVADKQEIDPGITGLQKILAQAQSLLKNTFKAPIIPKGLCCDRFGKTLPCRGPNCVGIFGAKGTISSFDPFTGQRLAIGGSQQFVNITGANFAANQARINQGLQISNDLMNFIDNITEQLKIKQTNTV